MQAWEGTMLTYHSNTSKLLGAKPRVSPAAVEMLDQVENRIGRVLPPSVREWYELELRALVGFPIITTLMLGRPNDALACAATGLLSCTLGRH